MDLRFWWFVTTCVGGGGELRTFAGHGGFCAMLAEVIEGMLHAAEVCCHVVWNGWVRSGKVYHVLKSNYAKCCRGCT